jgi:hypothetical protein
VGEQLQGGDIGVAIDDAAHQFGARLGRDDRALLDPWHEVAQGQAVGDDPGDQRDHQAPVGFGEQHQRADGVDCYVPDGIDGICHGRVAQRVAGLHDALGNTPGEVVLEEVQALLEHIAVVLPADQAGHAGAHGLVHQQIVQGTEKDRAQQQAQPRPSRSTRWRGSGRSWPAVYLGPGR